MTRCYIDTVHTAETEDDCVETEVRIHFTFSPGSPAVMYQRNGDPGWPAESAEVEMDYVEVDGIRLDEKHPLAIWAAEYLTEGHGYEHACREAVEDWQAARDDAMEMRRGR